MKASRKMLLVTVVLALSSTGWAQVNSDGDWQLWTHQKAHIKISDKVSVPVSAMYRFGEDMSKLWYQHYDVGLCYKATPWLSILASYRHKMVDAGHFRRVAGDRWINIKNPNINFIFSRKLGKITLQNNCRFSYWDYDDEFRQDDLLYYRNIFTATGSALTSAKIAPYVEEDFFFSTNNGEVDRNRISAGVRIHRWKVAMPQVYMMWQTYNPNGLGNGENIDNYIVGLDCQFKF